MLDLTVSTPSPALSRTSVIDVVDHIGVVTRTAHERVRALAPVERVVPRSAVQGVVGTVANDDVVQLVAGALRATRGSLESVSEPGLAGLTSSFSVRFSRFAPST